jgi:thioredoxin 1
MITEITEQEYASLDQAAPKLIEFYSKTCGPCKMLSFVLKDIAKQKPEFPIYIIDFDENRELKEQLGVKGFPTMLFFKEGKEISRLEGLKQKPAIIKAIDALS